MSRDEPTGECLEPAEYVDSAAPNIVAFARQACEGATDPITRAVRPYYAARDSIVYTPYVDFKSLETFRAAPTPSATQFRREASPIQADPSE